MVERDWFAADFGTGDAADLTALPEEHRRALGHLKAARESAQAIKQAATGRHRLVLSHGVSVGGGGTTRMLVGATADWELLLLNSQDFIATEGEPGARWQPIGTVSLWRELGPDLDWIDILFVARIGDQQIRLPVTMEDEVAGDDEAERSLLVLDSGAEPPVSAGALRSAFGRRNAVVGVVIRKGLGAFVVVEIDMHMPQGAELIL